ncbi:RadC family protein [Swaminathania salitolerans]|uniref:DNA repair protein RadC n=1 Tax=Swaminathania salitolerans TaxID=182838 RepID=A0A511BN56_9PROT|nr:DNA repair protein RadC [Swaminathania salitolerans]GBQ13666.1 DNA repair protein RadC [Swaminathania salitolerans LMG 21291]GEL01776.1 DNA repair protein RadC [Swaminathania salitolerans]
MQEENRVEKRKRSGTRNRRTRSRAPDVAEADETLSVTDWAELPHRALMAGHGQVLSDEALLGLFAEAIGVAGERGETLARVLHTRFGSLASVFAADTRALQGMKPMDGTTIAAIRLLHEAALRYGRALMGRDDILSNRKTTLDYLFSRLARESVEQFLVLFLDGSNRLIAEETQTRGTVNHTPVYPREVARRAMELGAHRIILVHNHPSGDPTPSREDIAMTRDVSRALALIEVGIADHIIIGNGAHMSFRDSGLLDP